MLFRLMPATVLLAFIWLLCISGPGLAQMHIRGEINLEARLEGKKEVRVELDPGLTVILTAPAEGPFGEKFLLQANGRRLAELEGGKFPELVEVRRDGATYWIVSEYTGGAHCCGVYHFFSRAEPTAPVRHLGKTEGHNGGPRSIRQALVTVQGELFFTDLDNRFDYFHESHAGCMLVNLPERHYQLSPTALRVNNLPFKAAYLKHAQETQKEIQQALRKRSVRPAALLKPDFGDFSDDLGQLLVKRTLYLVYAREDQRAWESFAQDVGRYYRTSRGVPELKAEIIKMLPAGSY